MMTIKEFQEWFDERFLVLLKDKSSIFIGYSNVESIQNIVSYLDAYARGGKRLRPYMAYVGYTAEDGGEDIFPLYAAIELLHLFCLVHDDVMDNEPVRHGTLTVHRHMENLFDSVEIGRALAILLGDLLLAWAYECVAEMEMIEPYTIDEVTTQFAQCLSEVIHGQMLDVSSLKEAMQSKGMIETKMEYKSARYSFFHPLYVGMLAAGAGEDAELFAEEYATNLGMAFQLQDDVADYASDIAESQQTLLSWFVCNEAPAEYRELFETYNGKDWSDEDEKKLQKLLDDSGAFAFAAKQIEDYFLAAEDAIFNHDKTDEEIWHEIIEELKR
jgi:geranylgeranyl diphosphate synthase type I